MKGKYVSLGILTLTVLGLLAPILIENANAAGCIGSCYLQTDVKNVPGNDATITIRLDNTTYFTLPRLFAFANGTRHSIEVMNVSLKGLSGTRYVFRQWEQCGNQVPFGTSAMLHTPLMMANYTTPCPSQYNGPYTARFDNFPPIGCTSNCNVQATTSVPSTDATVFVRLDNLTYYTFPHTFSFPNGTIHTLEVMNTTIGGTSGARYVWTQWTQGASQYSTAMIRIQFIGNYTYSAQFDKQFQLTLTFKDSTGQPVSAVPSSVKLQSGTTILTLSSYSTMWISAVVWTVADATWQGLPGSIVGSQTIDMTTGSGIRSVQLKAYALTIRIVDRNNAPIQGANVTVTLSNSTRKTFISDAQGNVQLGQVTAGSYVTQVTYQGQKMGTWSSDASVTQTNTIQLNVGPSPSSNQVSAVVLLTIFGIAFFLLLLAIKVRKPPPPPTI